MLNDREQNILNDFLKKNSPQLEFKELKVLVKMLKEIYEKIKENK